MKKLCFLFAFISIYISAFSQAPTISSFSPDSGSIGTLVTITGTNLSSPTAFTIGGAFAIVVSDVDSILVGMVMPGAVPGAVSVTTAGGTTSGSGNFTISPTFYPNTQQGNKLVGTGADTASQGWSVALSADGNTAIVGGPADNGGAGAAWIYTRLGTTWTQQGAKLVGTGALGAANQGHSVSISADGNTAIVGGPDDNNNAGAAWVYTRSGTAWTQQGGKLVGSGAASGFYGFSGSYQGYSVGLSADGNTAIVCGPGDTTGAAAWVYTRSGTIWSQQGSKLMSGSPESSFSVALSADGNTAIVGAPNDSSGVGAALIYVRSGAIWMQQGNKLVGTGAIVQANQGISVSLSADGNTAIVGGNGDNHTVGAAWVYIRSGTTWTQQGSKLVGTGVTGAGEAEQGFSVSLSADGNTAIVGGWADNRNAGAAWVYTRSDTVWTQQGNKLVGTGAINTGIYEASQGYSVSLSADGNTAVVGGPYDNSQTGAAWVYVLCMSDSSTAYDTICADVLPYTWNGLTLTIAGTYHDTLTNTAGCDSLLTLHLIVKPTSSSTTYDTISSGALPYLWNGLTFTGAGAQTAQFTGSAGCDSAATLILTVGPNGISDVNGPSAIHLYPNPNKGSFTLATSGSMGSDYTISDMIGNVISQQRILSDSQPIELPETAEGVYTLSVKRAQPIRFVVVR